MSEIPKQTPDSNPSQAMASPSVALPAGQGVTLQAQSTVTPGYKTTEFWVTLICIGSMVAMTLKDKVPGQFGAALTVVSALAYKGTRLYLKRQAANPRQTPEQIALGVVGSVVESLVSNNTALESVDINGVLQTVANLAKVAPISTLSEVPAVASVPAASNAGTPSSQTPKPPGVVAG